MENNSTFQIQSETDIEYESIIKQIYDLELQGFYANKRFMPYAEDIEEMKYELEMLKAQKKKFEKEKEKMMLEMEKLQKAERQRKQEQHFRKMIDEYYPSFLYFADAVAKGITNNKNPGP